MRPLLILLLMLLPFAGMAQPNDFVKLVRAHAAQNEGAGHLATALEQFDYVPVMPLTKELDEILKKGWTTPHPGVLEAFQKQGPALGAAVKAASTKGTVLPPVTQFDASTPVPNFLQLQLLLKLIAADGWRMLASGDTQGAAERAGELLRLSQILRTSPQQPLITRLIGVAGMDMSLKLFEAVLSQPNLPPPLTASIGSQLYAANFDTKDLAPHVLFEFPSDLADYKARVKAMLGDPQSLKSLQDANPAAVAAMQQFAQKADSPELDAQIKSAREVLAQQLTRPLHEGAGAVDREQIGKVITDATLRESLLASIPDGKMYYQRSGYSLARLHGLLASAALKAGKPDVANTFLDPFTGKPLLITETVIYSLGPDLQDQGGQSEYEPKSGPEGTGDIVVKR